jgi:transposase-like protein
VNHPISAILALRPANVDRDALEQLVGNATVGTLAEVAREFGVVPSSVKGGWRAAGMPGTNGNYRLIDILLWRLERDAAAAEAHSPRPESKRSASRLTAIERRLAKLEAKLADRSAST